MNYGETVIHIQGFFDEDGTTGIRDSAVYELCRRKGLIGVDGDHFSGWMCDPYDKDYNRGVQMNLSEQEQYDEMFRDFHFPCVVNLFVVLQHNDHCGCKNDVY